MARILSALDRRRGRRCLTEAEWLQEQVARLVRLQVRAQASADGYGAKLVEARRELADAMARERQGES